MSNRMLSGRKALVTGSTSGIGLGIARQLAAQGADLVINGFGDPDQIRKLTQDLAAEFGVAVDFEGADLGKVAEIEALFGRIDAKGPVDILVNNAGIQFVSRIENFPVERWDAVIALNLSAVFHGTRLALPAMQKKNWGRIVNIASAHGLTASPFKSAYVAAKHGVVGLTKVTALENARSGVTANAICPGWVLTSLVQKQIDERAKKEGIPVEQAKVELLGEKQPSLEFVTPEQLGGLAVFLCSPAADEVRGVAWNMDGGWVAQ